MRKGATLLDQLSLQHLKYVIHLLDYSLIQMMSRICNCVCWPFWVARVIVLYYYCNVYLVKVSGHGQKLLCSWVQESLVEGLYPELWSFPSWPGQAGSVGHCLSRKKWKPTEHSWLCSPHFVSGRATIDYFQTMCQVFLATQKALGSVMQSEIHRRKEARRSEASSREVASQALILLATEDAATLLNKHKWRTYSNGSKYHFNKGSNNNDWHYFWCAWGGMLSS